MEITRKNFVEELPEICSTISKANFFAIDAEFTGLASDRNIYPFDTPEEVYQKTIENSAEFIIIQLGLCAFTLEEEKLHYKCYNFYVFPNTRSQTFSCQGESMRFLADNGFDFNKLFREGITYCNSEEETKMRKDLKDRQDYRAVCLLSKDGNEPELTSQVPVPEEEEKLMNDISDKIELFLKSDSKDLIIDNCNGFQRKLLYQMIDTKFANTISTSSVTLENNYKAIKVERKRTPEEEQALEDERVLMENDELLKTIGLSIVLQELSKSKKLIIGHNMLLDILYITRQFFQPLPYNYEEFKKIVHSLFPLLCDTKFMCNSPNLKHLINSSVLQHLYQSVQKEPFQLPEFVSDLPGTEYSLDNPKEHEAGYDAFLTGNCFLAMVNHLKVDIVNMTKNSQMKKMINRLFLLRVQDVNYINLCGREPIFSKEHIFYITFPESWKQSDIVARFKKFGSVYISWVNQTSAFVSLNQKENASCVIKHIGHYSGFKVVTYNEFKLIQQNCRRKRRYDSGPSESSEAQTKKEEEEKPQSLVTPTVSKSNKKKAKTFAESEDW